MCAMKWVSSRESNECLDMSVAPDWLTSDSEEAFLVVVVVVGGGEFVERDNLPSNLALRLETELAAEGEEAASALLDAVNRARSSVTESLFSGIVGQN